MSPVQAAGLQVLIVEDEHDLGHVFGDYVGSLGHRAEVVGSAEAALERLRAAAPHVILLDIKLPGMSGLEFLQRPDVRESGVPVIVVSGYVSEEQARQCLKLGALEFLAKPVPLQILGSVLEHVAVMAGLPEEDRRLRERRLAARTPASIPVRVYGEDGREQAAGAAVEVSATGLRARLDRLLTPGAAVRLSVALPDGNPPLEALALVVRADGDRNVAFWFLDLTPTEVERLLARPRPGAR